MDIGGNSPKLVDHQFLHEEKDMKSLMQVVTAMSPALPVYMTYRLRLYKT